MMKIHVKSLNPYERIYKTDDDMPNIIKLTHEELNKKLGGIVVLID